MTSLDPVHRLDGAGDEAIPGDRTGPPHEGGPRRTRSFILALMLVTGLAIMYGGFLLSKIPPVKRPQLTYTIRHSSLDQVKDHALNIGVLITSTLSADSSASAASSPTIVRDGTNIPKVEYQKKGNDEHPTE